MYLSRQIGCGLWTDVTGEKGVKSVSMKVRKKMVDIEYQEKEQKKEAKMDLTRDKKNVAIKLKHQVNGSVCVCVWIYFHI